MYNESDMTDITTHWRIPRTLTSTHLRRQRSLTQKTQMWPYWTIAVFLFRYRGHVAILERAFYNHYTPLVGLEISCALFEFLHSALAYWESNILSWIILYYTTDSGPNVDVILTSFRTCGIKSCPSEWQLVTCRELVVSWATSLIRENVWTQLLDLNANYSLFLSFNTMLFLDGNPPRL